MNSNLSALSVKIIEFSGKTLSTISEQTLAEARALIKNYVDVLVSEPMSTNENDSLLAPRGNILHFTARFGDTSQLQRIFDFISSNSSSGNGCDTKYYANVRDENFFTPLHHAAIAGWADTIQLLIDNGADSNPKASPKDREWVPIHYAAKNGHLEAVKVLLENKVDKEVKTSFGLTPLLVAAELGHCDLVEFLLSVGADKDVKTIAENYNMNALHYAAVGGFADLVKVLLNAGINIEEKTSTGLTALYFAVSGGYVDVIDILLVHGADTELKTESMRDLLYTAALKGKKDAVSILLKWGIGDLNEALKAAKQNPNKEIVSQIESYKNAVASLFKLKDLPMDLELILKSFTADKLSDPRIEIASGVFLNAYGIMNVKTTVGLISKEEISLVQFAQRKGNDRFSDSLTLLEKMIKIR